MYGLPPDDELQLIDSHPKTRTSRFTWAINNLFDMGWSLYFLGFRSFRFLMSQDMQEKSKEKWKRSEISWLASEPYWYGQELNINQTIFFFF